MFTFIALAIIIPLNFIIALVVLLRNFKIRSSQYFSLSIFFVCLWAIGDLLLLSSTTKSGLTIGYYLYYIAPIYTSLFMVLFAISFKSSRKINRWLAGIIMIASTVVAITVGLNRQFLINSPVDTVAASQISVNPSGWLLYTSLFVTLFSISYVYLFVRYKRSQGVKRLQLQFVTLGIFLSSFAALVTNLLLPLIGNDSLTWAGPVFTIFYVSATLYAIVKHRLFDITSVVLRLMAYVLSLLIIIVSFSLLLSFGLKTILPIKDIDPIVQFYYASAMVFAALSFGPIKSMVDHLTDKLFFQKRYSVQEAIDKISSFSTKSTNPRHIETHALRIFDDTIRPEYSAIILFDKDDKLAISTKSDAFPSQKFELEDFYNTLAAVRQRLIVAEDEVSRGRRLDNYIQLANIGLIVRLSTNNKSVGYLVLGLKRSGGLYTSRDLRFITIASNDLALALQNALAFEEIQSFNTTLQNKINDATQALKRTNKKLVALDDAKDEFISMASHQLRTPLTSVKGYISMMLEGDLGRTNATQKKALKEAFDSSQRMVFLISDFLNVSRIRTGKFLIETTPTDLHEIVLSEITQLKEMAKLRSQTLSYVPPVRFPTVLLDESKTRQVMMNMIDNAIFYTPSKGIIEIILEIVNDEVVFKVKDNGIGVPIHDQHRLFTKFFRASNAQRARPDGTGLGLFMAQKIITEQGGKIIFESSEGKGSTFGFRFPLNKIKYVKEKN